MADGSGHGDSARITCQNQGSGQSPSLQADASDSDITVATKSDLMVMKFAHSAPSTEKKSSSGNLALWAHKPSREVLVPRYVIL